MDLITMLKTMLDGMGGTCAIFFLTLLFALAPTALAAVYWGQSGEIVRRVQQKLEELEQMVIDARFECTGPQGLTTTEYEHQLTKMLKLIRSIDEANES